MSRYAETAKRPLELALAIRGEADLVYMTGEVLPMTPESRREWFAGAVPVVLDQVSDWWDQAGSAKWPDERLEPTGRLPWPIVWAEWSERSADSQLWGICLREHRGPDFSHLPLSIRQAIASTPLESADYLVGATIFTKSQNHPNRVVVLPSIVWGAHQTGESVKGAAGKMLWLTTLSDWAEGITERQIIDLPAVWRLFTALLRVRGSVTQDAPLPRPSRRAFARISDGLPPWIHYKTLSVDLTLPGQAKEVGPVHATAHAPRGVPLHLVRASIADYRNGRGLFGKYKCLVWRPAHRRGYQRLGVVAKTYEAQVPA